MKNLRFILVNLGLCFLAEASICRTELEGFVARNYFAGERSVLRDITTYSKYQHPDFSTNVFEDTRPLHVMDLGAGDMVAAREMSGVILSHAAGMPKGYFSNRTGQALFTPLPTNLSDWVRVTAMSVVTNDTSIRPTANFTPFVGRFFEDIPTRELLRQFGPVDVFVDFWGVLAYSSRLDEAFKKILALSALHSQIYFRSRGKRNPGLEATTITRRDGREVDLLTWLSEIPGIRFEEVFWGSGEGSAKITFKRNPQQIIIPTLEMSAPSDFSTMPPRRRFREL